ncbi:S41 family peptidase [Leptospira bourretii]|uniref:S41 family peptidase n=1 Tax=Leptospira bourretii TaxID=2484962 RepID=A0A4R9IRI1_9LEPT|nr:MULTISPECIES: S41 family peptidase [Leptospira]MCG6139202.1 S41 family peptidase [Leptospira mtsangambouensis]TGK85799.1 S41 family peptidase [Leptospira bourretii]TGK94697.1 S41 family peptidase [Leptospira bourretii]TGL25052.1 S41 family peptidase [Leptospira bourretii]TGL41310.1 S41 family peptidase [Leptospira bourretii]
MKRIVYLLSFFALLSFALPVGFISCEPEAKKAPNRKTDFTYGDFETVIRSVDKLYIDKHINVNRAFTDAASFSALSLPHPLYIYPESYFKQREKYDDKEDLWPGTTFKLSPSDAFVIFDPDYDQVEKIQKEKRKKNENRKLSDAELKKLIEKEKLKKSVISASWEEINFSKKDFDRVISYIQDNLEKYKTPVLKGLVELDGELEEEEEDKKEFSMEQVFVAAANGYLNSLDPHSNVFLEEVWEESMKKISDGSFEGIGAILSGGGSREVIVENPLEGSPALKAGIRSGDSIVAVDGKLIKNLSLDKVVKKIKGPKATKVVLTISRKGNTGKIDIEVVRDKITIKNVTYHLVKENPQIAYIKLTGFVKPGPGEAPVDTQIAEALSEMEKTAKENGKPLKALILDLRGNSGGFLNLAIDIADMFIEKGLIVSTRTPSGRDKEEMARNKDITKLPLAILINSKSASASEIVASAIQHHGRGILLGERTFGKATVQTLEHLDSNPAYLLKITNARYYSPSGKTIQVVGVSPDIEVSEEQDGTFPFRYREEDMWNHLPLIPHEGVVKSRFNLNGIKDYVKKNGKADTYLKEHAIDAIKPDYMLIRSLDYIEGMLNTK